MAMRLFQLLPTAFPRTAKNGQRTSYALGNFPRATARPWVQMSRAFHTTSFRQSEATEPNPPILNKEAPKQAEPVELPIRLEPRMLISFECGVCSTKVQKSMSKHAYTKGAVVIRCDGCQSLHLIADNIDWFSEKGDPKNIEEALRRKGIRVDDTKGKKIEEIFSQEVLDHNLKKTLKHSLKLTDEEALKAFIELKNKKT